AGGTLTIAGNQIQFAGANPLIAMDGPGSVTISAPVDLTGPTLVAGAGAGGGLLTLSGQITGPNGSLSINRPSTNFFSGATVLSSATNNFGGGITLQSGILAFTATGALSTGPITIGSTGIGLNATGELRVIGNSATVNNPFVINAPVLINNGATLTSN